jgi:hypothetical protein
MLTARNEKIGRLRGLCLNEVAEPVERLKAGWQLLKAFGPSEDSVPIIRKVIKAFEMSADPEISERALKLGLKLAKALDLRRDAKKADIGLDAEDPIGIPAGARPVILNGKTIGYTTDGRTMIPLGA